MQSITKSANSIANALQWGAAELGLNLFCSGRFDAEILLCHATGISLARIVAFPERQIDAELATTYRQLVKRRADGMPIAYLTGRREFWSMPIQVDQNVLIPRPDTEILVERALLRVDKPVPRIADLGTGSGAIAIALASELPNAIVTATDKSAMAVAVAKANALRLGTTNVTVFESDWRSAVVHVNGQAKFDLIVSNPPYIAPLEQHLHGEIRFEPVTALVSQNNGLADLFHLIERAPDYLLANGWLLLEHGYNQASAVADRMRQRGYQAVATYCDYGGNPRVTEGQRLQSQLFESNE